jgi:hypothetical protein
MALVTAYLARTGQLASARGASSAAFDIFGRIGNFFRITVQAFSEARALEREMMRKYPFLDV